jgi:hypothetical protein
VAEKGSYNACFRGISGDYKTVSFEFGIDEDAPVPHALAKEDNIDPFSNSLTSMSK